MKGRALLVLAAVLAALAAAGSSSAGLADRLEELGGKPCPDGSEFTCVTLSVPLDHFAPAGGPTIDVAFAVLPATGKSKGLFVTAMGGPGSAGIAYADSYTSYFAPSIRKRFDVVFFDQRGIGLSGGLTCPSAAVAYYSSSDAPATAAGSFATDCVREMGSSAILPYAGTAQAIEDLEDFRLALGGPTVWLYGESYGTQYAQQYAAAHGGALGGLVLDGVVDLTLTGPAFWEDAAGAFERVLDGTLASCDARPRCRGDAGRSAETVYDGLAARLAEAPLTVSFPLADGTRAPRPLTTAYLESLSAGQVYGQYGRLLLQRAIAAAGRGDLIPLERLAYANLYVDPQTLEPIADPTYSDGMYYGVDCQDYAYFQGTTEERTAAYLAQGQQVGARNPRLGEAVFLSDLPCVYWPGAAPPPERPAPLVADGVPTLVLVADADPITPVNQGDSVYRRLADGWLVTTRGGPHVTFGRGNPCPDRLVTAFLVSGTPPGARETTCPGRLVDPYVPLPPRAASGFASLKTGLESAETQLQYLPEFAYWDGVTPTGVGCDARGAFRMTATGVGARFAFRRCAFTRGLTMTGTGSYDYGTDRFVLDVRVSGRWSGTVRYVRSGATVSLER